MIHSNLDAYRVAFVHLSYLEETMVSKLLGKSHLFINLNGQPINVVTSKDSENVRGKPHLFSI
jgi:hypothetical protein